MRHTTPPATSAATPAQMASLRTHALPPSALASSCSSPTVAEVVARGATGAVDWTAVRFAAVSLASRSMTGNVD
jgi:hypothetical protein